MFENDNELQGRLSPDEQAFYDDFEREANGESPVSSWGKSRAKDKRADITNRGRRLSMEFINDAPYGSWEKVIIDQIDNERSARESNDIAPGIIRDGRLFRCSKFTPNGTLKAVFADEESARDWMMKTNKAYDRVCR